ncbi:isochorismatase family protein [Embleya sp. NBC_00888]|uniref:isochorismatase family protein n=1 Tax=Embleya sp. NBC_00888 TaxID=2975960 RepID=UPI00386EF830
MFAVEARHAIRYQTPLEYLLNRQRLGRVVLCGQVAQQRVLSSALDAHLRHFRVVVAQDAVARIDADLARAAFRMMERAMHADIRPWRRLDLRHMAAHHTPNRRTPPSPRPARVHHGGWGRACAAPSAEASPVQVGVAVCT